MFAGYAKGFLTVAISVVFYHEGVDGLEIFGYVTMLLGQLLWSLRKLRPRSRVAPGEDPGLKLKLGAAAALAGLAGILSLTVSGCILVPCQD